MTKKDGKGDPDMQADTSESPHLHGVTFTKEPTTPALFPLGPADRSRLQERLYTNVQRSQQIEAQLTAITSEKREELKKLKATIRAIVEELEQQG